MIAEDYGQKSETKTTIKITVTGKLGKINQIKVANDDTD